jgi:hypothetical protein
VLGVRLQRLLRRLVDGGGLGEGALLFPFPLDALEDGAAGGRWHDGRAALDEQLERLLERARRRLARLGVRTLGLALGLA